MVNVGKYTIHGCYGVGKNFSYPIIVAIFQDNQDNGR